MELSEIHFHDSVLRRVIEVTEVDELHMEVEYPVDWQNEQYEPRTIVFKEVLDYEVHEGDVSGSPTILSVEQVGADAQRVALRIETSAGYRVLKCHSIDLQHGTAA